jgi:hypothetical protein
LDEQWSWDANQVGVTMWLLKSSDQKCFGDLVILEEVKNVSATVCLGQEAMEDFSSFHADRKGSSVVMG